MIKKILLNLLLSVSYLLLVSCAGRVSGPIPQPLDRGQGEIYYARCNLKVIKGSYITWVNWQSTPTFIPINTELRVLEMGDKATLTNVKTNSTYSLDIGAIGTIYLEKFVTKFPVNLNSFSKSARSNIQNSVARLGMTKEEVYSAMGPPTQVASGKTNTMSYEAIMASDLWIYARRRFGKNIGVAFDPGTGRVNRTEGIWR